MSKKQLLQTTHIVKFALGEAARAQEKHPERAYGMRCAAHTIANEVWWQQIAFVHANRKFFADYIDWMEACGFYLEHSELLEVNHKEA